MTKQKSEPVLVSPPVCPKRYTSRLREMVEERVRQILLHHDVRVENLKTAHAVQLHAKDMQIAKLQKQLRKQVALRKAAVTNATAKAKISADIAKSAALTVEKAKNAQVKAVAKRREVLNRLKSDQEVVAAAKKVLSEGKRDREDLDECRQQLVAQSRQLERQIESGTRKQRLILSLQRRWRNRSKSRARKALAGKRKLMIAEKKKSEVVRESKLLESKRNLIKAKTQSEKQVKYWRDKAQGSASQRQIYAALRKKIRELECEVREQDYLLSIDESISKTSDATLTGGAVTDWLKSMRAEYMQARAPYPLKYVKLSMILAGNGLPASKITGVTKSVMQELDIDTDQYNFPHETTHGRWRFGLAYAVQIQIGQILTSEAHKIQDDSATQTIIQDGTPVDGRHVEAFVIKSDSVRVAMIPWVQAGKSSLLSAQSSVKMTDVCQLAYNKFYNELKPHERQGLPSPVPLGSLVCNITDAVNDHAANEMKRVEEFSSLKKDRAIQHQEYFKSLGADAFEKAKAALLSFGCNTHKQMLLAKAFRTADNDFLKTIFPDERDRNIGELRTNNILDALQIQVFKMFGHTSDSYAFGSGATKFPQWMRQTHPGCWKGLKRLVGNRSNIFLENAVVMYFMANYYLEYCDYVLRRVHGANALHK